MNDLMKRTWAEIDLTAIRHNYQVIRSTLPKNCRFLGVVKADAYGHGALIISKLLEEAGADYLAVSCLDEALELRRGGITMPILILGHTPTQYTEVLIRNSLTQTVTCLAKALQYSEKAKELCGILRVHLKLDTGMSRLGYLCSDPYFDIGEKTSFGPAGSRIWTAKESIHTLRSPMISRPRIMIIPFSSSAFLRMLYRLSASEAGLSFPSVTAPTAVLSCPIRKPCWIWYARVCCCMDTVIKAGWD